MSGGSIGRSASSSQSKQMARGGKQRTTGAQQRVDACPSASMSPGETSCLTGDQFWPNKRFYARLLLFSVEEEPKAQRGGGNHCRPAHGHRRVVRQLAAGDAAHREEPSQQDEQDYVG